MTTRVQADVDAKTMEKMKSIKMEYGIPQGELIKRAVKLFDLIMAEADSNGHFTYLNKEGKEVKLVIL